MCIQFFILWCVFCVDREVPLDLELPNQWLWEIIDEFLYQVCPN